MVNKNSNTMKINFFLITLLISCSVKVEHPDITGTVYNNSNKRPLQKVKIDVDGDTTYTNKEGQFFIKNRSKTKLFNFESGHDPVMYRIIFTHPKYISDTIEESTRGSFGKEKKIYDSIFLSSK